MRHNNVPQASGSVVGLVPVKDRYWHQAAAKKQIPSRGAPNKNAASESALRRIGQEVQPALQAAHSQNLGDVLGGVYGVPLSWKRLRMAHLCYFSSFAALPWAGPDCKRSMKRASACEGALSRRSK